MTPGELIKLDGCVTMDKYIKGRTLQQIESILGFHCGRFRQGIIILELLDLPQTEQFDLLGYTQVASHNFNSKNNLKGPEVNKLKQIAQSTWSRTGPDKLVKVLPNIRHDENIKPDVQYPPGQGAPQWNLNTKLFFKVTKILTGYPEEKYLN